MDEEHRYEINSNWIKEKIVTIEIAGKPTFEVSTPIDFWPEARTDIVSPEDLFVASLVSCYGVSLSGASQRFHAELTDFAVKGIGRLAKGEFGWEFDQVSLFAKIVVPTETDKKRMEKAAERAHTYCVIGNSLKCPVHLDFKIIVEPKVAGQIMATDDQSIAN
ncbi:MAG: OsmC family peroxiredoxin [Candidatus Thorarchaeota archaeon]|nr:OsmC family peroxiredoxin [Candidatus Thorarchaeota archaeon]